MTAIRKAASRTSPRPTSRVATLLFASALCAVSFSGCQREEQNATPPLGQSDGSDKAPPSVKNQQLGTLLELLAKKDAIEQADKGVEYNDLDEATKARKEQNRQLQPVREAIEVEMRRMCPDLFGAFDKHKQLTELQWPDHADGLLGKTVVAVGNISDVQPLASHHAEEYARRTIDLTLADDDPSVVQEYNRKYGLEPKREGEAKREALQVARRNAVKRLAEDRVAKWRDDPSSGPCYVHIDVPALGTILALADGKQGKQLTRDQMVKATLTIDRAIDDRTWFAPDRAGLPRLEFTLSSTVPFEAK